MTVGVVWAVVAGSGPTLCQEVRGLLEATDADFVEFLPDVGDDDTRLGIFETTRILLDSDSCSITRDPERTSYLCSWEFDAPSSEASDSYDDAVVELRTCLGPMATERHDAIVNHPDFFDSTYFELPRQEVSVSLKNKNAQQKVYVSIGVDSLS